MYTDFLEKEKIPSLARRKLKILAVVYLNMATINKISI